MKSFIFKILKFCFPIFVILGLLSGSALLLAKKKLQDLDVSTTINVLMMGDSHIANGLNDTIVSNAKNLACSSESYWFTYEKIKLVLDKNPQINTILLGASFHNFAAYYEPYILQDNIASKYFLIFSFKVQRQILKLKNNPLSFLNKSVYYQLSHINGNEWATTQGFKKRKQFDRYVLGNRIATQYYDEGKLQGFSSNQIEYFEKIANYCKEKNVKLLLINTPLHKEYKEAVPPKFRDKLYSLVEKHQLEIIEFDDISLLDTDFSADGDHIGFNAAMKISESVNDQIKK